MGKTALVFDREVTVRAAGVSVSVLKIEGRQLTLSVFRQIPVWPYDTDDLFLGDPARIDGELWGWVNYFWAECTPHGPKHYVVEHEGKLWRWFDTISYRISPARLAFSDHCKTMERLEENKRHAKDNGGFYYEGKEFRAPLRDLPFVDQNLSWEEQKPFKKARDAAERQWATAAAQELINEHIAAPCGFCDIHREEFRRNQAFVAFWNRNQEGWHAALDAAPQLFIAV